MIFLKQKRKVMIKLVLFLFLLSFSACAKIFGPPPAPLDSGLQLRKELLEEQIARNDKGMETIPAESDAFLNFMLGELALKNNELDKALDHFEEVSELEEGKASTLRKRLAQIYLQKGELDSASEELAFGLDEEVEDFEYLQLYGGVLVAQKKYDEAIKVYEKISSTSPKAYEHSMILVANAYEQKGEVKKAKKTLGKILKTNPDSIFAYYYRARLNESSKKIKLAKKDFLKALELGASDGIRYDYARFLAMSSNIAEAKIVAKQILDRNPSHVKTKKLLARILLRENKVDDALAEFESLSELEADSSSTRLKIAVIKLEQQDFAGAEKELRLVLGNSTNLSSGSDESMGNLSAARYYLGSALAGQKKNSQAVDELSKINEGDNYFLESQILSAIVLRQLGEYEKAANALSATFASKTLGQSKPETKHYLFLASLQKEAGQLSKAEKTYQEIIKLEPDEANHHFALGVLYEKAKKFRRSEKSLEKAISLDPKNADALNHLGYSLSERGKKLDYAEELVLKALKLDPKNGYFLDSLGWIYYKKGDMKKALINMQKASDLVPEDPVILEHLAIVQKESGLINQSMKTLTRAKALLKNSKDIELSSRIEDLMKSLEQVAK